MSRRSGAIVSLLIAVGCLAPRYEADLPSLNDTAGNAGANAKAGSAGASMSSGGSATLPEGGSESNPPGGSPTETVAGGGGGPAPSCLPKAPTCTAAQKVCDDRCVERDDPAYGCAADTCNNLGCPQVVFANFKCVDGACVVKDCKAPYKPCNGVCIKATDPRYGCGPTACQESACPIPDGNWLRVCEQGACATTLQCPAGTKRCGAACVPTDEANGCEQSGCLPCEADEVCSGSPSQCTCVPDDVEACKGVPCGMVKNNCGQTVLCPDKCPSPSTCSTTPGRLNSCVCP